MAYQLDHFHHLTLSKLLNIYHNLCANRAYPGSCWWRTRQVTSSL
uniref:Uncharacterized protein n=1 Tax=Anguilla anguilla TaxID=7936 RepID=A0A0E9XQN7_ANGAN